MDLKVTLVQLNHSWKNKSENFAKVSGMIDQLPETDVVLLPEMFATGFSMDVDELAEEMTGTTVSWMKEKAASLNAVVAGSLIVNEGGRYLNRLVWALPDGEIDWYDKRHLFTMGEEHLWYSPGNRRVTVERKGWKIRLQVCYDLRFPVWSRNHDGYDLLVYLSSWPSARHQVWKTLLQARALENQCFCAGVNRTGEDGNGITHSGDSGLITPKGETAWLGNGEATRTFILSRSELDRFREKFPVLKDRDSFKINY